MRKETKRTVTERMTQLLASKQPLVAIEAAKLMLVCEGLYPVSEGTNIKVSSKSRAQLNLAQAHVAKILTQDKKAKRIRNQRAYLKRKGYSPEEIEVKLREETGEPKEPTIPIESLCSTDPRLVDFHVYAITEDEHIDWKLRHSLGVHARVREDYIREQRINNAVRRETMRKAFYG